MPEHKTTLFARLENLDTLDRVTQDEVNARSSAVADAEPYHFRRASLQETSLSKIGVLGDDGKAVLARVLPNLDVGSPT
jgi:hypothetical protein